jgi:phenazine biosynthesis protein phzE
MTNIIENITTSNRPFSLIQKQDSEEVLVLTGTASKLDTINAIYRRHTTPEEKTYDTISMIPFCQIRERGYNVIDEGDKILSINIEDQQKILVDELIPLLPDTLIKLGKNIKYDMSSQEYEGVIQKIIAREIGNGEGANFVIPRNATGVIEDFSIHHALTIFKALLENDYGTYWKFIFYDGERFFIGSTPERHLYVGEGRVKMNPISGTFRKSLSFQRQKEFKRELLAFLRDQKEINELFMVVDEELKMMAKMCDQGGTVVGPILKEMSRLIHSEYLLVGKSSKDIFELFKDSMYAATVVGSPVENACNIIKKYSSGSRRYYGSAMMLVGRDTDGNDFLDSPITIRTVEIASNGKFNFSVGATLVRDSVPSEEVQETEFKAMALVSSIVPHQQVPPKEAMLHKLYNDDDIIEILTQRNQNLSNFWFFQQEKQLTLEHNKKTIKITIIHNEDDFVFMLQHLLHAFGIATHVEHFSSYDMEQDDSAITILGPGPGNPNDDSDKIRINMNIAKHLLENNKKAIFVCLGHQILCRQLGFTVVRKQVPFQGVQKNIDLFGKKEIVGFYNTFVARHPENSGNFQISSEHKTGEIHAIQSRNFIGFQFHPESILTQNGYTIIKESIQSLLAR